MGGSPPPAPAPPDPIQTGRAQTSSNVTSGVASQFGSQTNLETPWYTNTFEQDRNLTVHDPTTGDDYNVPGYKQTVTPSAESAELIQNTFGTQAMAGGQAQDLLRNAAYGTEGGPGDPNSVGNLQEGYTHDLLNRQMQYYQPLWDQQRDRLDTQLRNQGIMPEMHEGEGATTTYASRMRDLNDQIARDQSAAITNTAGQARQWATEDYLRPLQTAQSLYPLGTPAQASQQQAAPLSVQPTNWVGIYNQDYQNRLSQYNAQNQANASQNAGIAGMISPFARIFSGGMFG